MLGAEKRLSRRVSFVTENYLIPNQDANVLISYGLRFFGEKLSADLAFWNAPGNESFSRDPVCVVLGEILNHCNFQDQPPEITAPGP